MSNYPMIDKLCTRGSSPISHMLDLVQAERAFFELGKHKQELLHMLEMKNGFYAFESALHVFPFALENRCNNQDLLRWNSPETWKKAYGDQADDLLCFAEDIFGYQFCSSHERILRFDPETARLKTSAQLSRHGQR
jgi:hypothetical protein